MRSQSSSLDPPSTTLRGSVIGNRHFDDMKPALGMLNAMKKLIKADDSQVTGMIAPAGVPAAVIKRLQEESLKALQSSSRKYEFLRVLTILKIQQGALKRRRLVVLIRQTTVKPPSVVKGTVSCAARGKSDLARCGLALEPIMKTLFDHLERSRLQ